MCKHVITDQSLKSLAYNLVVKVNNGRELSIVPLREDLLQELALIICEKTEDELAKIHGYFNFWCVRTLINMCGKRGNFTKKYAIKDLNYEDAKFDIESEYDGKVDETLDKLDKILTGVHWYKRDLFKLYLECGTFRAVEDEVGINYVSVYHTIKDVKKHIIASL